jgi:hypothetical protein
MLRWKTSVQTLSSDGLSFALLDVVCLDRRREIMRQRFSVTIALKRSISFVAQLTDVRSFYS